MKSLKLIIALSFVVAALVCLTILPNSVAGSQTATNAPTTQLSELVDDLYNGFRAKGSPIDECAGEPVPLRSFEDNKFIFSEVGTVEDGLGPTYNDKGCAFNATVRRLSAAAARPGNSGPGNFCRRDLTRTAEQAEPIADSTSVPSRPPSRRP